MAANTIQGLSVTIKLQTERVCILYGWLKDNSVHFVWPRQRAGTSHREGLTFHNQCIRLTYTGYQATMPWIMPLWLLSTKVQSNTTLPAPSSAIPGVADAWRGWMAADFWGEITMTVQNKIHVRHLSLHFRKRPSLQQATFHWPGLTTAMDKLAVSRLLEWAVNSEAWTHIAWITFLISTGRPSWRDEVKCAFFWTKSQH